MNFGITNLLLVALSAWCVSISSAQSEKDLDRAVESIEELAEEMGGNIERLGDSLEQLIEQNSRELERWAEQHAGQWEQWASQYEQQLNRWAQQQEQTWETWAQQYSQKWERWAEQLESNEMNSGQLEQLLERNLEMIGQMPLGQMIDGMIREGTQGLKDAPWGSLRELQSPLPDSHANSRTDGQRALAELRSALQQLQEKLDRGELNQEKLESMLEKLAQRAAELNEDEAHSRHEAVLRHRREAEERLRSLGRDKRQVDPPATQLGISGIDQETEKQGSRVLAEQRLEEALRQIREGDESSPSARELRRRVEQQLELKERHNQEQKSELDTLRRELRKLRQEVEQLKKSRAQETGK